MISLNMSCAAAAVSGALPHLFPDYTWVWREMVTMFPHAEKKGMEGEEVVKWLKSRGFKASLQPMNKTWPGTGIYLLKIPDKYRNIFGIKVTVSYHWVYDITITANDIRKMRKIDLSNLRLNLSFIGKACEIIKIEV